MLAAKDGDTVMLRLRSGRDFDALRRRAFGGNARPHGEPVTACFFDLLALDGRDLQQLPLVERKRLLKNLLPQQTQLVYVDHVEDQGEQLFAGARKLGLEGIVAKKADSPYLAGGSGAWRKFKLEETSDFVVNGIPEPTRATFMRTDLLALAEAERAVRRPCCTWTPEARGVRHCLHSNERRLKPLLGGASNGLAIGSRSFALWEARGVPRLGGNRARNPSHER